jgi:sugar phosphate isomerase/epimerase
MQYGAMNFPVRPVLEELEQIALLGFDYLELSMDPPQAHHSTLLHQKSEILRRLNDFGMQLVCHMPTFLCLADLTESIRMTSIKETLDSLDVAAELEPLKIVLHPGYVTGLGIFVFDKAKGYAVESLATIVEHAEKLGLTVCLENMFPRANSLTEPNDFAQVFDHFPGLKLTLDTGHANIGATGGKRIKEFISRFPDKIEHIHASDNFGKEDNHLPIGTGTIDFSRFAKTVREMGYDKTVTFEVFSRDKDYLKASREKFKNMLTQSGGEKV